MEEMKERKMRAPGYRQARRRWLAALALLAAAAAFLFLVNRFTITVEIDAPAETVLEFGQEYEVPPIRVMLVGTHVLQTGIRLDSKLDSVLEPPSHIPDTRVLGKTAVTYTARWLGLEASGTQTVRVVDTQSPVITLRSNGPLPEDVPYEEEGFTATDNVDGDITHRVIRTETPGLVTYTVLDSSGNPGYVERQVPYYDSVPPMITLLGDKILELPAGKAYFEPGYTARDNGDGEITDRVEVEGKVDCFVPGTYTLTYRVADSRDNIATATRQVEVVPHPRPDTVMPEGKTVYLTFDDGPGVYTLGLLDVLDRYGVKATFFVTDTGNYDVLRQIVKRGHSIGIHTVSHNYGQIYADPEAYFRDLYAMQNIIFRETGEKTTLMRFPGGSSNAVSRGTYPGLMTLLTEAVRDAGFQYFDWNVDSNDAGGAKRTKTVRENVIAGLRENRVSIVLQHDIHGFSVDAVEDIIRWGLENGYRFLPLEETSPGFHHELNN